MPTASLNLIHCSLSATLLSAVLVISGCGVGLTDSTSGPTEPLTLAGRLIGGENPIIGATVNFYETSSTGVATTLARGGYYAPAVPLTPLGTTVSTSGGNFNFVTPIACSKSTDFVYATATGGNSGANVNNANILLAAAVGSCANVGASTFIIINEVTTVAAAYALQGFSSLAGTNLSVTASATNYATVSAPPSSPSAAGLSHAFANAANLVNASAGAANANVPGNPAALVPQSRINTLANSIQACVNSGGGVAGDGSPCGSLFTYTTYSYNSGSPAVTITVTPTNTFGALLAIVRYPTLNVANIYNLGQAAAAFQPADVVAPTDWSMYIQYPKFDGATNAATDNTTTGLFYPVHLALDAGDNVYVLNSNVSSTNVAPAAVQSQSNIVAFSSNGTPLYATAVDTTTNTKPRQIATDGLGNLFEVSDSGVTEFVAASGSASQNFVLPVTTGLQSLAIDNANNFFVGATEIVTASTQNVYEYLCSSGCSHGSVYTPVTFGNTSGVSFAAAASIAGYTPTQLFIDKNRNLWASNYNSTAVGKPFILAYSSGSSSYATAETTNSGVTNSSGYYGNYGISVNNANTGWIHGATQICKLFGGGNASCGYYNNGIANSNFRLSAIDGNGNVFNVDNFNGFLNSYPTNSSAPSGTVGASFLSYSPCTSTPATPCASAMKLPVAVQIDSTGSAWVTSAGNGSILQFIGVATPTWPLLADLKPGVMP